MTHDLKTWPEFFQAIVLGHKTFEIRKDDRNFSEGDALHLLEWEPNKGAYTGRECYVRVTYLTKHPFFVPDGSVVMAISLYPEFAEGKVADWLKSCRYLDAMTTDSGIHLSAHNGKNCKGSGLTAFEAVSRAAGLEVDR